MPGTTRARALGAGRTGSQDGHARSATRRRPISQSTRAQGKSSTPQENAGLVRGWGHNEARRLRDGGIGAGGTMPTPVRRASSGGGSVPPPEPPQGATATIAKTPFFFVATRLRRHFQPWIIFSKIAGGKVIVPRLTSAAPQLVPEYKRERVLRPTHPVTPYCGQESHQPRICLGCREG